MTDASLMNPMFPGILGETIHETEEMQMITFKGAPLTLRGTPLKAGDPMPPLSLIHIFSAQTPADFQKHCADLESQGYKRYFSSSIKGNEYVTYKKDGKFLHTYFTAYAGEIRTIKDNFSTANFSVQAQSYTKVTDTAVVQLIHNLSLIHI